MADNDDLKRLRRQSNVTQRDASIEGGDAGEVFNTMAAYKDCYFPGWREKRFRERLATMPPERAGRLLAEKALRELREAR